MLKVSERLALRVFLAPVEALLAALAVFLLGAALAMVEMRWSKCWARRGAAGALGARAPKFSAGAKKRGCKRAAPALALQRASRRAAWQARGCCREARACAVAARGARWLARAPRARLHPRFRARARPNLAARPERRGRARPRRQLSSFSVF